MGEGSTGGVMQEMHLSKDVKVEIESYFNVKNAWLINIRVQGALSSLSSF